MVKLEDRNVESYELLVAEARSLGFDAVGVARAEELPEMAGRLERWLNKGCNAGMDYMARNKDKRRDVRLLVEGARSLVVTLTNYYMPRRQPDGVPLIARYAYGKDYHLVIKERLRELMKGKEGRCFVDSAPLFEHEWARKAGLGWIGRNTLLLNRDLGSFCFIGIFVTTAVYDHYSVPFENNYCGTCDRCIRACPTGALSEYEVDARKCISYQTIENKDEYPVALKQLAGNRVFGCDACQEVCPWNSKAQPHRVAEFLPGSEVLGLTAADWRQMSEHRFKELFKDTPLERTGLERLKRNL